MLSYRHAFHAGNHADVLKHYVLTLVLAYMKQKDKPFWYTRQKSLIQAKLGDKKGAIETAKQSLEAATLAKNEDYAKMNRDSITEWSKK